ncbi:MAG: Nre family DNA repair protein [Thermoplasmata archaeon]
MRGTLKIPASLCMKCRGSKMLCGLSYCPVSINSMNRVSLGNIKKASEVSGSSPPSVFVGRYGYPKVLVYPSSPPINGNTYNFEESRAWPDIPLDQFVSMRMSLVRGSVPYKVDVPANPDSTFQRIQEMALAGQSVDVDIEFSRPLDLSKIDVDENTPPMGPASPLRNIEIGNVRIGRKMEKVYYDTDLKASEAMSILYREDVDPQRIAMSLSTGSLGIGKNRKIVPTRWAITAIDQQISNDLVKKIKEFPSIDKFLAYRREVNGNLFVAILTPSNWIYEWGEGWFPGSTWNMWGTEAEVEIDYEGYYGRKTYPDIGGCYYASRVAVSEAFERMGRSGGSLAWREIYPGFNLPVGVWFVRENMRRMFQQKPEEFDTIDDAIECISKGMRIDPSRWKSHSYVYKTLRYNNLERFFSL